VRARTLLRAGGLAAAAAGVAAATSSGRGGELDTLAFDGMYRRGGGAMDAVALATTELGSIWASAGAAAVLALFDRRRVAARAFAAAGAAWLLGQAAKRVVLRPRPYVARPDEVRPMILLPRATSWPSSHPMVLLAFVTVAGRELGASRPARAMLSGLAGLVGATRPYLGVHYPSDVIGGLLLGRAVGEMLSDGAVVIDGDH
jgi:membrane-associated phospholipid phosphatase